MTERMPTGTETRGRKCETVEVNRLHVNGNPSRRGIPQTEIRVVQPRSEPAMGKFTYSSTNKMDFDDRVLAHLQVVISNKLRRSESFMFTWRDDASLGDGRTAVWLNPNVAMSFKYFGSRPPALNRAWVEALAITANSPTGLYVVPEPAPVEKERELVDAL